MTTTVLSATTFILLIAAGAQAQAKHYTFYPDEVTVHGKLVELHEKAAAGSAVSVMAIKLDHSISVGPSPRARDKDIDSGTYPHVAVIQLFFPGVLGDREARKIVGRFLVVKGTFSERLTPGQFTDVTMDVKSYSVP